MPSGVPILGSRTIGVDDPDDKVSLVPLRLPSTEVIVLRAILNRRLPPLKRRRAEKAVFIVPIDESVAATDAGRLPLERYVLLLREPTCHQDALLARMEFRRSIVAPQLLSFTGPRAFCNAMYVGLLIRALLINAYRASHSSGLRERNMTLLPARILEFTVGGDLIEMSSAVPRRNGTSGVSSNATSA